ncbi:MAG: SAM-dependent methyltransferase [Bdellovibrionales bacterium]
MKLMVDLGIPNTDFYDLCCDHGFIGIEALKRENFKRVIFIDQVSEIIDRLVVRFEKSIQWIPKQSEYLFLCQDVIEIEFSIHGTLVIAGVGGQLILKTLKGLLDKNKLKAKRIIINPLKNPQKTLEHLNNILSPYYAHTLTKKCKEGRRERFIYVFDLVDL